MYKSKTFFGVMVAVMAFALLLSPTAAGATRGGSGGRGDGPVIYVTGQGLVYDSIVTARCPRMVHSRSWNWVGRRGSRPSSVLGTPRMWVADGGWT